MSKKKIEAVTSNEEMDEVLSEEEIEAIIRENEQFNSLTEDDGPTWVPCYDESADVPSIDGVAIELEDDIDAYDPNELETDDMCVPEDDVPFDDAFCESLDDDEFEDDDRTAVEIFLDEMAFDGVCDLEFCHSRIHGWMVKNPRKVFLDEVCSGLYDEEDIDDMDVVREAVFEWSAKIFDDNNDIPVSVFYERILNMAQAIHIEYGVPAGDELSEPISKMVWDRLSARLYEWLNPLSGFEEIEVE